MGYKGCYSLAFNELASNSLAPAPINGPYIK